MPPREGSMTGRIGRREFVTLLASTAAWPFAARAQQPERMRRIGVLMGRAAGDPEGQKQAAALQRGLEELHWSPPRIAIEFRWFAGDAARAQAQAKEIVELGVDIIVANGTPALVAARQAAETIPIVFVAVADPVAQGFVRSLAQPGGIITGLGPKNPAWERNGWRCSRRSCLVSHRSRLCSIQTRRRLPTCFSLRCRRCVPQLRSS